MAVTFAINSVLDRLTQSVVSTLTAQDEPPAALPRATTAEQAADLAKTLPATVLEVGECHIGEDNANIGSLRLCQPVTIHHVRSLVAGGSGVETATTRLAAIAKALYGDYRLESVSQSGDQSIEMVRLLKLGGGSENRVQQILDASDENDAVCCVSLSLEIDWVESPGLPALA